MYINKMLKMLHCHGDVDGNVDCSHYSSFVTGHCSILAILLMLIYFLVTAVGFKPSGSCKYTFAHKQYTKQPMKQNTTYT
jgi:hypothetical protein